MHRDYLDRHTESLYATMILIYTMIQHETFLIKIDMRYSDSQCLVLTVQWMCFYLCFFFFSSRRRHTRCSRDWSSDVCSSDLKTDEQGDYFPKDYADWREIPSETLHRKELRGALQRALNSLPTKYREVLILRDVQHLSIQETAQALDITEGSVKTRLLRARFQMRDALAPGIDGSWYSGKQEYEKVRPW